MSADYRFRGHQRRYSDTGACSHPSAESLIGRLDELDIRLRQLEDKQSSLPVSYFSADLERSAARNGEHHHHHQCKSLSSALHDVRLKGTLMDRLHILETRIRQLSSELDKGSNNAGPSVTTTRTTTTRQTNEINESMQPQKNKKQAANPLSSSRVAGAPWRAGDMFRSGAHELQVHKPKTNVKDSKETIDHAMDKRKSATRRNEKGRMERTRIYKRWFPVGC